MLLAGPAAELDATLRVLGVLNRSGHVVAYRHHQDDEADEIDWANSRASSGDWQRQPFWGRKLFFNLGNQARAFWMLVQHEHARRARYTHVLFSRLDLAVIAPLPPPPFRAAMGTAEVAIPRGDDFSGFTDVLALTTRAAARVLVQLRSEITRSSRNTTLPDWLPEHCAPRPEA